MSNTSSPLWVLELNAPQMAKPLKLHLEDRLILGRNVAGETQQLDVDLSPYGAEAYGVSRQHLVIAHEHNRLMVTDLNSGNGTFINGHRLKPGEAHSLGHGDQLQLGRLRLDVQIIISPTYGSSIRKQASLQIHDQTQPGSGQLVMIVEDDLEIARALAAVVEQAGYTTKLCHEVVGAIRAYNQKTPSAIIIEQLLPDINGLEFCRYVRRDVHGNALPIMVISASRPISTVSEVMQAGADIFLDRPVSAKELRHVISSMISQHKPGGAPIYTKHLVGTALSGAVPPESRRDAAVLFIAGHSETPITLNVKQPVSFGRAVSGGSAKTHVDLSRYDAINFGVSRLHMMLHNQDGKFYVQDLDSINGTFINGDPIKPSERILIANGDEIRLGQLRMYIYFLEDPNITASDS